MWLKQELKLGTWEAFTPFDPTLELKFYDSKWRIWKEGRKFHKVEVHGLSYFVMCTWFDQTLNNQAKKNLSKTKRDLPSFSRLFIQSCANEWKMTADKMLKNEIEDESSTFKMFFERFSSGVLSLSYAGFKIVNFRQENVVESISCRRFIPAKITIFCSPNCLPNVNYRLILSPPTNSGGALANWW